MNRPNTIATITNEGNQISIKLVRVELDNKGEVDIQIMLETVVEQKNKSMEMT